MGRSTTCESWDDVPCEETDDDESSEDNAMLEMVSAVVVCWDVLLAIWGVLGVCWAVLVL